MYLLMRVRKAKDELYGQVHASLDDSDTFCGLEINSSWWITKVDGKSDEITCKKCKDKSNDRDFKLDCIKR